MKDKHNVITDLDLNTISTASGVYLMSDDNGRVLYVGKARNLRARLRNYVRGEDSRAHIQFLLRRVAKVETIVTDTEKEALILENTLIKKHKPRYNINLRDDKTYVSLRIDMQEEFPAIQIVRRVRRDGALYFGPYSSAAALKTTLKQLSRIFPLRHHRWSQCQRRDRPCLYYQIGQCSAPCHGKITAAEYQKLVKMVIASLSGKQDEVIAELNSSMQMAAEQMRYEDAARLRDQIRSVQQTLEQQKVVGSVADDIDVLGWHRHEGEVELCLLFIRAGRLVERRSYAVRWSMDEDELLAAFLQQYYGKDTLIPPAILLPLLPTSAEVLQQWLGERRGKKVTLQVPQRGVRSELLALACKNAAESYRERGEQRESREKVLLDIQTTLGLRRLPRRMECYDISHVQGTFTVGSMVVVTDGEADKGAYRHFRIKTVTGSDDYAALYEVLTRRLGPGAEEDSYPDMVLIDGGKGQLSMIEQVLDELGLSNRIDLVSIAKSRVKRNVRGQAVERSEERFFRPGRKNPVVLRHGSPQLFMLERLRDEAHRFAITYHRKLRDKASLESELEQIPGIGSARRKLLISHCGSVRKIKVADLEQLRQVPGLPETAALAVYEYFHPAE
ncbi:MAG: excinuclease ABC subunit C [Desulfobacteraceae bacterium 4572_35.1]|nr:MAG: excinuclease ABC subunit C [Desulfobacteraceae bacterium 4572_35.1]